MPSIEHTLPAEAVTDGSGQYYFGYYNVSAWDASGRYLLGLEAGADRLDRYAQRLRLADAGHDAGVELAAVMHAPVAPPGV